MQYSSEVENIINKLTIVGYRVTIMNNWVLGLTDRNGIETYYDTLANKVLPIKYNPNNGVTFTENILTVESFGEYNVYLPNNPNVLRLEFNNYIIEEYDNFIVYKDIRYSFKGLMEEAKHIFIMSYTGQVKTLYQLVKGTIQQFGNCPVISEIKPGIIDLDWVDVEVIKGNVRQVSGKTIKIDTNLSIIR